MQLMIVAHDLTNLWGESVLLRIQNKSCSWASGASLSDGFGEIHASKPMRYAYEVARGWESKSVEAQQAEVFQPQTEPRPRQTPEQKALSQRREGLMLSRKHIIEQMAAVKNPQHQKMLADALAELDVRLARLG
jgi:hypothetical protein